MYELAKVCGYLLTPLPVVLLVWLLAGLFGVLGRRAIALTLACTGFAGLWLASTPFAADALVGALEAPYPAVSAEAAPAADAILVLGGSVAARHPPMRPSIGLNGASTRVWYTAELYRAGKAKWVVVAAGGVPDFPGQQVEAEAIAEMLVVLGVPRSAIRLEAKSRNTRENALKSLALVDQLRARRVLLVTSSQHMGRALKTFAKVWTNSQNRLIPAPTDVEATGSRISAFSWIPSPSALLSVSKALKEYAGMAALAIM
jgi:uncharacterized SAM-binding protein YcdF (DUF218 family)